MSEKHDFLFEIGCEELPAKMLLPLAQQLADNLCRQLQTASLNFGEKELFASPRRLAIIIHDLDTKQPDQIVEKKGPAISAAFDAAGQVTPAALGFARSCKVEITALQRKIINNNEFLVHSFTESGCHTKDLLPKLCQTAISQLSIPKPMRWCNGEIEFIRPVHWVVLLLDDQLIKTNIFGIETSAYTYGHRFHHPQKILLTHPKNYVTELKKAFVIADFNERKKNIEQQIKVCAEKINAAAVIDPDLLTEVTGLVEWPVALLANFNKEFLQVPKEALISAMQKHQKSFPLIKISSTITEELLPHFITIANIDSNNVQQVISGNEKVMTARLADAAFFYETDCKHSLDSRLEKLKGIIFQKNLGDLYERSERLEKLAQFIADKLKLETHIAARAGLLCKTDLVSAMVEEFPELQGIMGYYYALNDNLSKEVAMAIKEHYHPRFSGDSIPESDYSCVVSLADRFDKLIGIFGINQKPTGEKDPFALRRAALGALQIIIEKHYNLDLKILIAQSSKNYQNPFANKELATDVLNFILERLRYWYQEKNISMDIYNAVAAREITNPYDFHLRVHAVEQFRNFPQAQALAAANKRVSNILTKENVQNNLNNINPELLSTDAEKSLAQQITLKKQKLLPLIQTNDYAAILTNLADLQEPIDKFFDQVMVMVEDEKIRNNRLALLNSLRELFLQVADISKLQI